MNRNASFLLMGPVIAGIAVLGVGLLQHGRTENPKAGACGDAAPAYWYDPMAPQQRFDKPGKSPFMDMQLVPKCAGTAQTLSASAAQPAAKFQDPAAGAADAPAGSIAIDPRVVQNLGVRLAAVERGNFARTVDAVGVVAVDEHRIEALEVRQPGWVEELDVRAVGDSVSRGQRLAGVYAPDLLATQQELLIARNSGDSQLIEAARHRLGLFGLSAAQIAHIEKTGRAERRVDYFAPFDGYVMDLGARQGAAVAPGTVLFQLAALDSVWINAEVPETQVAWIKKGDPAMAELPALPGEHFDGQIDYLYPELMPTTRTLKVRVVVKNRTLRLRPGMFATVHLRGATQDQVLTVPTEAVIKTGTRSVVIVADDGTHFRPALVRVGPQPAGRSEILEGLSAGQNVVASGQFLIDSEASLRGAFENLAKPDLMPAPSAQAPDGGH
ncbi:MAG: rane fusion protein copper/silver efflux system [Gammaproteobacteria bacterium]|nr:rane fusion protein copper/silver efflux system [Gammaproteobacteria bacterium]